MILLLAALASATIIVLIGRDVFHRQTALGPLLIQRSFAPVRFWAVLALYGAAAMTILMLAIYDRAQQPKPCEPSGQKHCVLVYIGQSR